jgi:hypothetical protein
MIAVLAVEFKKLNRSLALLLAVVAPALIAVFTFFSCCAIPRRSRMTAGC